MQNVKKIFASLFILGLFVVPSFVLADVPAATLDGLKDTAKQTGNALGADGGGGVLATRLGSLIGILLSFVGVLFFILMIYAGITWMTAQGNTTEVDKAKKIMGAAIIGLVFVLSAYAITSFVGSNVANQ